MGHWQACLFMGNGQASCTWVAISVVAKSLPLAMTVAE